MWGGRLLRGSELLVGGVKSNDTHERFTLARALITLGACMSNASHSPRCCNASTCCHDQNNKLLS